MSWHRLSSAFKYVLRAQGAGLIHSPFVFEVYQHDFDPKHIHFDFQELYHARQRLLSDTSVLQIQDFGAGSTTGAGTERTVASIAKSAVKKAKYAELMYRLMNRHQPNSILEIGTSLGLTSLYLQKAVPKAKVVTLEGAPELCKFSGQLFREQGCPDIEIVEGAFDQTLKQVASRHQWDVVFVDGNHREKATVDMTQMLLKHASPNALFVIDDIYWSKGMTAAWESLRRMPEFTLSIDLFEMGLLWRKLPMEKQHFVLRY